MALISLTCPVSFSHTPVLQEHLPSPSSLRSPHSHFSLYTLRFIIPPNSTLQTHGHILVAIAYIVFTVKSPQNSSIPISIRLYYSFSTAVLLACCASSFSFLCKQRAVTELFYRVPCPCMWFTSSESMRLHRCLGKWYSRWQSIALPAQRSSQLHQPWMLLQTCERSRSCPSHIATHCCSLCFRCLAIWLLSCTLAATVLHSRSRPEASWP